MALSDILFTKAQKGILGLLYGHPERSFFTREILGAVGTGVGIVHRLLHRMVDAGLISMTKVGNQRHYQANTESPIFEELRSIVVKTVGLVEPVQLALAPYTDKIKAAFIYGSVARGTDRADSDIDLMIIADDLTYSDVFAKLHTTETTLRRKINPTVYSESDWYARLGKKNAFATKVNEAPKIFVIGSEIDLSDGQVAAR